MPRRRPRSAADILDIQTRCRSFPGSDLPAVTEGRRESPRATLGGKVAASCRASIEPGGRRDYPCSIRGGPCRAGRELLPSGYRTRSIDMHVPFANARSMFGAVSYETQTIHGQWEHGGQVYNDKLIRVFVDVPDTPENRAFFPSFKERLKS